MGLGVDLFINECVVCYSFGTLSAILQSFLQNILPGLLPFWWVREKSLDLHYFFVLESIMMSYSILILCVCLYVLL